MNLFKTIIAVLAIFAVSCFIIPLMIKYFFLALLFVMQKPLIALAITGAFLLGMFFNENADKIDEKINSL